MSTKIASYSTSRVLKARQPDPYGMGSVFDSYLRLIRTKPRKEFTSEEAELADLLRESDFSESDISDFEYRERTTPLYEVYSDRYLSKKRCPYCSGSLLNRLLTHRKQSDPSSTQVRPRFSQRIFESMRSILFPKSVQIWVRDDEIFESLYQCTKCGWWALRKNYTNTGGPVGDVDFSLLRVGEIRNYDLNSPELAIREARRHLAKHPSDLAAYDPYRFELLLQDCLQDLYGTSEVIHMGFRRDRGIDLKVFRHDNDAVLVQIKRRANFSTNEGVEVVRSLNGVLLREGLTDGLVITTAKGYTKDAIAETKIKTSGTKAYSIQLFSFENVVDLLNLPTTSSHGEPWAADKTNETNKGFESLLRSFDEDNSGTVLRVDLDADTLFGMPPAI